MFEPAGDQTFELIVSNPPFILAPTKEFVYRDNELDLDQFCRRLARQAPRHLVDGGIFQMVCDWVEIEGQSWQERVTEWFAASGCDGWVLKANTQLPRSYANARLHETSPRGGAADAAMFESWMAYYRDRGVRAIHGGLIALRKRSGANWVRIEELDGDLDVPVGEAIVEGFARQDFLQAQASDESILALRLVLAASVRLESEARGAGGRWQTVATRIRLQGGLPQVIGVDPGIAEFLAGFDGQRTVGELVADLARRVPATPEQVRAEALRLVRFLVLRGVLEPL
jgi:hypothetical protein